MAVWLRVEGLVTTLRTLGPMASFRSLEYLVVPSLGIFCSGTVWLITRRCSIAVKFISLPSSKIGSGTHLRARVLPRQC